MSRWSGARGGRLLGGSIDSRLGPWTLPRESWVALGAGCPAWWWQPGDYVRGAWVDKMGLIGASYRDSAAADGEP
ncbi:hypothetical protein NDU88_003864 [Pleurodeles waltl]|uniref:Uncharacterized protein n=1 Tax=Pleurodeles waltl TaxID=8319 RepID=A0AAV7UDQ3_PLEWA|nr:hypothetical protein NDU88_003864 [Pleurodeles waltl]